MCDEQLLLELFSKNKTYSYKNKRDVIGLNGSDGWGKSMIKED